MIGVFSLCNMLRLLIWMNLVFTISTYAKPLKSPQHSTIFHQSSKPISGSGRRLDGFIQTPAEDRTLKKLILLAPLLYLQSFAKNPLFRLNIDYEPEEIPDKPYYHPPKPYTYATTAPPPPPPPSPPPPAPPSYSPPPPPPPTTTEPPETTTTPPKYKYKYNKPSESNESTEDDGNYDSSEDSCECEEK